MSIHNILKNDKYIIFYDSHEAYDRMNFNTMGEAVIRTKDDTVMVIPYKSIMLLKRIKEGNPMVQTDKNELIQNRIQRLFDTEDDNIIDNILYNLELVGLQLFTFDGEVDYWNFRNKCSELYENLLDEILEKDCSEYNMAAFQRLIQVVGDLVGKRNVPWFFYLKSDSDDC